MPRYNKLFHKNPTITIIVLLLILIVLLDLFVGWIIIPSNTNSFRTKHHYYHHGLKPIVTANTTWNGTDYYNIFTNSLGFRDADKRNIPLTTSNRRILMMGDSQVEGVGLDFEDTFIGILQSDLDSNKVEIYNAGVVGYSQKLYYLKTKYLIEDVGFQFTDLIVFIDISDIQNELVFENFNPGDDNESIKTNNKFIDFLKDHSFVYYFIRLKSEEKKKKQFYELRNKQEENPRTDLYYTFFDRFGNTELLQNEDFHSIGSWFLDKEIFDKWGRQGLTLGKWHMIKLAELCRQHNIRLIISVHPWPLQIVANDWNSIQVQFWKKFTEDHHTGFINFFAILAEQSKNVNVVKEYYFNGDVHFNKKGNLLIANILKQYLNLENEDFNE